jgi:hypothetical protein
VSDRDNAIRAGRLRSMSDDNAIRAGRLRSVSDRDNAIRAGRLRSMSDRDNAISTRRLGSVRNVSAHPCRRHEEVRSQERVSSMCKVPGKCKREKYRYGEERELIIKKSSHRK